MSDAHEKLESELSGLRPRALSDALMDRIGSDLSKPRRGGDRLLIAAMCSGAMAACVIVTVLLTQAQPAARTARPATPQFGDASLALARNDIHWLDAWW